METHCDRLNICSENKTGNEDKKDDLNYQFKFSSMYTFF